MTAQGLSPAEAGGLHHPVRGVPRSRSGRSSGCSPMRHPLRRSWLVLGGHRRRRRPSGPPSSPFPARPRAGCWSLLVVVLAAGGPGSVVGIDIARTANPSANLGVAQSMVNMGGFLATLVVLAAMGGVLTALGGFTPEAFRVAWLVQYPVWLFAVVGILVTRRKARRFDAARGVCPVRCGRSSRPACTAGERPARRSPGTLARRLQDRRPSSNSTPRPSSSALTRGNRRHHRSSPRDRE